MHLIQEFLFHGFEHLSLIRGLTMEKTVVSSNVCEKLRNLLGDIVGLLKFSALFNLLLSRFLMLSFP